MALTLDSEFTRRVHETLSLLVRSSQSGTDVQETDSSGAEGAYVCGLRSYDSQ
jgi:hypothetical protein